MDGRASRAPYSARKLEASLLKEYRPDEVVVAHEDYIEEFIGEETEVIGLTTMDPFGLGPLSASYALLFATQNPPYVRKEFEALTDQEKRERNFPTCRQGAGLRPPYPFPSKRSRRRSSGS